MDFPWNDFLTKWSNDVFSMPSMVQCLPPNVSAPHQLQRVGASDPEICELESRLGTKLPKSYREFLMSTNGWLLVMEQAYPLWPVERVEWLAACNPSWVSSWSGTLRIEDDEYLVYGESQDSVVFRREYLATALCISDTVEEALYLLNPKIVSEGGEWEAWFMAGWLPGAVRYRSFWELMQGQYEDFIKLKEMDD